MGLDFADQGLLLQLLEGALWSVLVLFALIFSFFIHGYIQTYLQYRADRKKPLERSPKSHADPGVSTSNARPAKAA
jgi:hypothetical protein